MPQSLYDEGVDGRPPAPAEWHRAAQAVVQVLEELGLMQHFCVEAVIVRMYARTCVGRARAVAAEGGGGMQMR